MKAAQTFMRDMQRIADRNPSSHYIQAFCKAQIDMTLDEIEALQVEGTRASGEVSTSGASLQPLPDGNHGENVLQGANRD